MGTSASVRIETLNVELYIHYDGYPSNIMPWVESFHARFLAERGWDAEYEFAQLIRSSVFDADQFNLSKDKTCGFGVNVISDYNSYNTNYTYVLMKDGTITVQGD